MLINLDDYCRVHGRSKESSQAGRILAQPLFRGLNYDPTCTCGLVHINSSKPATLSLKSYPLQYQHYFQIKGNRVSALFFGLLYGYFFNVTKPKMRRVASWLLVNTFSLVVTKSVITQSWSFGESLVRNHL